MGYRAPSIDRISNKDVIFTDYYVELSIVCYVEVFR